LASDQVYIPLSYGWVAFT